MTGDGANGEKDPRRSQNGLPPEILDIVWPALQVGGLSGMLYHLNTIPHSFKRLISPPSNALHVIMGFLVAKQY